MTESERLQRLAEQLRRKALSNLERTGDYDVDWEAQTYSRRGTDDDRDSRKASRLRRSA